MATSGARVIPFPERTNGQQTRRVPLPPPGGQRPGEDVLCQWVSGLYMDALEARNRLIQDNDWKYSLDGYWGNYWPEALPSYKSPISINELKLNILQELSDLTDSRPTVYVTSDRYTGKRDEDAEKAFQAYWLANFLDMVLLEVCVDASVWPVGIAEVLWDPLLEEGQGEVVVRARAPDTFFPDPYATNDLDWRYTVVRDVMDLNEIKQRWPDQGRRVLPDVMRTAQQVPVTGILASGTNVMTPLYPTNSPVPTHGNDNHVTVYTAYTKDSTIEVVPATFRTPDGEDHMRVVRRYKYPKGRLIQCTHNVVLYEGPNVYEDGFPYVRFLLQPSLHAFWPRESLVSEVLEIQRASDKLESLVVENALRIQKGLIIADVNSGINFRTFADVPGQVVPIRPGSRVEILRPPPLPPDLIQHGERLRQILAHIMGHQPSRAGQQGRGNVSAELTETEISQSMGMTRLRARFLHQSTQKVVSKIWARMAQFYLTERHLPFISDGEWQPVKWKPLENRERYRIHVDPASFTVQSELMLKRLYFALARMGKMPTEDLLKELKIPRAKEIAQKVQQEMQLAALANQKRQGGRGRK